MKYAICIILGQREADGTRRGYPGARDTQPAGHPGAHDTQPAGHPGAGGAKPAGHPGAGETQPEEQSGADGTQCVRWRRMDLVWAVHMPELTCHIVQERCQILRQDLDR